MRACAPRPSARAFFPGPASLPPPRACAPAGRNSATRPPREGGRARARGKGGGARAPVGSVWLPQRQFRRSRSRRGPARSSSPLPRPLPPGRMRRRSASVGFGCVVAAEHSCEARESEPGGEGWSLHGGEPEEPPPLPTPPPQPPPPPPRRPPPGADGLVRSRRGGTRTSGRRLTAQHGPGNQAPLGGQLTGECAGREDHRAFQTVSDTRPGAALASRAPLPALARCRPLPCAELVRGPGPDPRTGAGAARLPGRPSARVAALGLGGAGAAVVLCLPEEEEEAVARPPRRRRREGALALARRRWGRVLASRCPAPQPCPAPPARHGRLRSPADARKCLAPRAFRASGQVTQKQTSWWVMSEHLGTGKTLDSRDLSRKVPRLRSQGRGGRTGFGFAGSGRERMVFENELVRPFRPLLPPFSLGSPAAAAGGCRCVRGRSASSGRFPASRRRREPRAGTPGPPPKGAVSLPARVLSSVVRKRLQAFSD